MFDIHQSFHGEQGDQDEELVESYCDGLTEAFAESLEGSAVAQRYGHVRWAHIFLEYGFDYLGLAPPKMSRRDVKEILFTLLPRKFSTGPEAAEEIIGEMRAFWEFLQRQYHLANATEILELLGEGAEEQLESELADPENFGMAKSLFMMGQEAGFDMTTREGADQFIKAYNAAVAQRQNRAAAPEAAESPRRSSARSKLKPKMEPTTGRLSADERKAREKLRRKKLGRSKRRG